MLCRSLRSLESGRSASVLRAVGPALLVSFLVLSEIYLVPGARGAAAAEWAAMADEPDPGWLVALRMVVISVVLIGWLTVSTIIAG